ncbi:MAG: ubiquinol oxidase subunit II [Proteobacteria bacterium]|nr:ubiquinol oxidase subunit II [Pseudomonadota bacterium]
MLAGQPGPAQGYPCRIPKVVLATVCLGLAACGGGVLAPRGPVGHAEKMILIDSLVIMLAIVVPTILATAAFAWWYRAGNARSRYLPDWDYSGKVELVVWFIPALVIILLAGVTWIGSHSLDPAKPLQGTGTVEVQVVSLDWKWLFIYPQYGVASVNELTVPTRAPLHFSLTSASVMNAFFVPQLGSMIYTMNGMVTQLNLEADAAGTYEGLSANYSGAGFSDMHFDVHAVSAQEFKTWVESARGAPRRLDEAAYLALGQQGTSPVLVFGSTDPQLFERLVAQSLPPGPGPAAPVPDAKQPRAKAP